MKTSVNTHKPVENLNAADLELFPVWQFLPDDGIDSDKEDETWVKPVASHLIPANTQSLCIAATARLPCGMVYPAIVIGDTCSEVVASGVAFLTAHGQVLFHESDSPAETRRALKHLGLSQDQVLPLEFSTRAPLASTGAPASGRFGGDAPPVL
jgi:hypothetical protein